MENKLINKIEARHRNLYEMLSGKKYTVDYFQREYNWGKTQIEDLIEDLTSTFLNEYKESHSPEDVENYNNYYLGSFVVSVQNDGKRSIIDGQQRLTSLILLLIFLNNLQKKLKQKKNIDIMIFSESYGYGDGDGKRFFNIDVKERESCLNALFDKGVYMSSDSDDESVENMKERYKDIKAKFPNKIKPHGPKNGVFPYFIDWLKNKLLMVEIITYSDENAYTIFATTNDRGLSLTPSEMLKGFFLSNIKDKEKRENANEIWKKAMNELRDSSRDEDQRFFQSWLRARYADTIDLAKKGITDFEKIGTQFHSWVRSNMKKRMKLEPGNDDDFERFIDKNFQFYLKAYIKILNAEKKFDPDLEHVFYVARCGIAPNLSFPLMLAPLTVNDSDDTMLKKINIVARYIETYAVRRAVNRRGLSFSSVRYNMCVLVKEIRVKNVEKLKQFLSKELQDMDEKLEGMNNFHLGGQNKRFVKFLLSRITAWIEEKSDKDVDFSAYYAPKKGKQFEVEHIWANKFLEHGHNDEFDDKHDFEDYRNRLGGLVLLQRGPNQALGDMCYEEKVEHYMKGNLLVSSLCSDTYKKNPNFLRLRDGELKLPFEPHSSFKKADIDARQKLYRAICEHIWPQDL